MRFRTYSRMKDSGVDWLGVLPEHWTTQRLKYLVDMVAEKTEGPSEELPYVGLENIEPGTGKHLDSVGEQMPGGTANLFSPGDVLFGKLRPYLAKALRPDFRGRCTSELLVLRPRTVNRDYLFYLCLSDPFIKVVDSSTYGTRMPRANWEFIGNLPVPLPPYDEQVAIRDFLETYTQSIDNAVEKYRLLIDHLQEYRQTLITQALTKGLDPNVPMKDSGIPWLGTVPKHWRVVRLKHLTTKIGSGKTPRGGSEVYVDDGIMLIRSMNVHDSGLKLDDVVYIPPEVDEAMAATRVKPNDVLLNITGASIGRTCLVPPGLPQANVNQHVCIVRPKFGVLPEYLMYALQSACVRAQIRATENGASREGLNFQQVGSLVISLPENSLDEQRDIVEFLRRKTRSIDATINQIEQQIRLIGVYRQALITAAVTGKIDVRQEVQEHAG